MASDYVSRESVEAMLRDIAYFQPRGLGDALKDLDALPAVEQAKERNEREKTEKNTIGTSVPVGRTEEISAEEIVQTIRARRKRDRDRTEEKERAYLWLTQEDDGTISVDMGGVSAAEMDRRMVIAQELRAGRLVLADTPEAHPSPDEGKIPSIYHGSDKDAAMHGLQGEECMVCKEPSEPGPIEPERATCGCWIAEKDDKE